MAPTLVSSSSSRKNRAKLTPAIFNPDYDLPSTVRSVRDGWQTTFQSAAVVSGLLAGVAAQLYGFFKDDGSYKDGSSRTREAIVVLCYSAVFFNIGATISGFILIDGLGEIQYHAASLIKTKEDKEFSTALKLLQHFGGGAKWHWLLVHWYISFVLGILSLLVLLTAYAYDQEATSMKVLSILFSLYIISPAVMFAISEAHSIKEYNKRTEEALPERPTRITVPERPPIPQDRYPRSLQVITSSANPYDGAVVPQAPRTPLQNQDSLQSTPPQSDNTSASNSVASFHSASSSVASFDSIPESLPIPSP
ncbi:hypothetical protein D9611_006285 [Ephemerocybe angulata]|uniref:Uncharacterized protein n=1 Tax=Ephemerocybe angulata TaxID=980116 RepID=A0A8H5C782_9AGAR|nr:hypothetical protein D9611_006285 [Tulosesus angulatus]